MVEPAAQNSIFLRVRLSYVVDGPGITPHRIPTYPLCKPHNIQTPMLLEIVTGGTVGEPGKSGFYWDDEKVIGGLQVWGCLL